MKDDRTELAIPHEDYANLPNTVKWFLMMYRLAQWEQDDQTHVVVASFRLAEVEHDFSKYVVEEPTRWYQ